MTLFLIVCASILFQIVVGTAFLVGAKVAVRTAGLPMSQEQYAGLVAMLHRTDQRYLDTVDAYYAAVETWRSGVLLEPTGAHQFVPVEGTVYEGAPA